MNDIQLLKHFLEYPIWTSKPIFDKFKTINNSVFRELNSSGKERFLFIPGQKDNKVVLVAHADTYFDEFYGCEPETHILETKNDSFIGVTEDGHRIALGADDRSGCAILWALKDSGHSLLITDGEEHGRIGSNWLMRHNKDIADIINQHQFMIQFDRRHGADFKCYEVGTNKFRQFIAETTGYTEPDRFSYTDICTLCAKICGVNFSVGYYREHSNLEHQNINEWLHTLNMARELLKKDLPRFELNPLSMNSDATKYANVGEV